MYGQTEATARISYVPCDRLPGKLGSIGVAIPEGRLALDPETHELLYSGPNVMLGYAESRADLTKGDELHGHLRTGDLATRDEDGFFYISGRLKRFVKVFGKRFSLDEIETLLNRHVGIQVACFGVDDRLCVAIESARERTGAAHVMTDILKLHPSTFQIVAIASFPRLPNGKLDYQTLIKSAEL
jgi:acyl-CoA synthetase (AMP-forming)/AMP-acid ligase II